MHRVARIDSNQTTITQALRRMGATVTPTHTIGNGFPDLAVGWKGVTLLIEIKDGSKPPSKRRLTPDEQEWHDRWRGQVAIVESVEDAVALLNGVGHDPDRSSLLNTIQMQDAEIQRLKAELCKVRA
jgi:hypothetical protein